MSQVKPFDLIANYARNQETHIRRNVTTALGAIDDERAVTLLAQMALGDSEASVRESAESELRNLDAARLARLRRDLVVYVQSRDRQAALSAMALVGRLRQRGLDLRESGERAWDALRRIATSDRRLGTLREVVVELAARFARLRLTYAFRWRAWLVGIVGALPIAVVLAIYVTATSNVRPDELQAYVWSAVAATFIILIFSTRRNVPLVVQWDPAASLTRDILETAVWAVPLVTAMAAFILREIEVEWWDAIVLGAMTGVAAAAGLAAVHIGNALAINTWRNRFLDWAWGLFVGIGAGAVAQTAMLWGARMFVDNDHEARLAEGAWLYAMPAAGGLAMALSRLDAAPAGVPFRERLESRRTRSAVVIASLAAVVVLLASVRFWAAKEERVALRDVDWSEVSGKRNQQQSEPLWLPETTYRFAVPYAQRMTFGAPELPDTVVLTLLRPTMTGSAVGEDLCAGADTSELIEIISDVSDLTTLVGRGCFVLRVRTGVATLNLAGLLLMRSPYAHRSARGGSGLVIRLNENGATFGNVSQQLPEGQAISWIAGAARDGVLRADEGRIPIEVSKSWELVVRTGAVGEPDARNLGRSLKLTVDGKIVGSGNPLMAQLTPGKYMLEVGGASPTPEWFYAEFEAPVTSGVPGSYRMLPAAFVFTQQTRGRVRAFTPQVNEDVVIELWRSVDWGVRGAAHIASGDDPPDVNAQVDPGSYVVVVRAYSGSSTGRRMPARPNNVTVEGDLAGPLTRLP